MAETIEAVTPLASGDSGDVLLQWRPNLLIACRWYRL